MQITIDFELDSQPLAYIWVRWSFENRHTLIMPESLELLHEIATKRMRDSAWYDVYSAFEYINDDLEKQAQESGYDDLDDFIEKATVHISQMGGDMGTVIERALEFATKAHEGQTRDNGDPYITHPIRVASGFADATLKAIALLHDVIEDTPVTAGALRQHFSERIVEAVIALSRIEDIGGGKKEVYKDFIWRLKGDALARAVKIADIHDNLRDLPADDGRRDRYTKALKILED